MKRIGCLLALILLISCQDVERPPKPENLISQDLMIEILADAYMGNAARSVNNRLLRTENIHLDSLLYKKYDIDSLQFATSNAYYTSDINTYTNIVQGVIDVLEEKKKVADSLYKLENEQGRKIDTLKIQETESTLIEPVQDLEE